MKCSRAGLNLCPVPPRQKEAAKAGVVSVCRPSRIAASVLEYGAKASFNFVVLAQLQGEEAGVSSSKLLGDPASASCTLYILSSSVLVPTCNYTTVLYSSQCLLIADSTSVIRTGDEKLFQKFLTILH
ncbi:hypothetical protein N7510_010929 [Penicillium lagena]|uniref:uncharacterized protein n=1 Tax=Penicillium lagena TaxID=94218 RepID=UPI0025402F7D|nr:uncharacterized protein N7510_010929 [Penicillium lagena]KAJ5601395.1 hypothetical protein N7510_010929 [Penicillium lagena]